MRILLFNVGYGTGLNGSLRSYLLQGYRYLYTPRYIIRQVRQSLYNLMTREKPDLCCFVEVHRKHGFIPHPHAYHFHAAVKYGRFSPLRLLPFFKDNCNAFCSEKPLHFSRQYFKNGTKKLVFEIDLPNRLKLILVHFALRESTRKRQCEELKKIINGRKNIIVCGDFNVFKGASELHNLAETCGLKIVNSHSHTFPAVNPKKALDLFLCPKEMEGVSARVLKDVQVSDHLPVLLEVA